MNCSLDMKEIIELLASELGFKKPPSWLIKELKHLISTYPKLLDFIALNLSKLSVGEILELFFKAEAKNSNLDRHNHKSKLRSLDWQKLHRPRIEHYLLADIEVKRAFNYCFNHRYNKSEYIRWEVDYTRPYLTYLAKEETKLNNLSKSSSRPKNVRFSFD